MSDKMYRVEIADATGHSVVEMTKTEISEKARSTEGTWVFVDDRLVSADEIDNLEMADDASVRLMPGLVGGVDEPTITVEIADATGHSVVEMTKSELTEKATSSEGTWVFVDDRLVSANEIDNLDMADDASVRLMPGLVGGTDEPTITVEIADATGHSVVEMTKSELTEKATSSEGTWVFVDDRLVSAAEIDNLDFSQASKVRLMPGLVGGF